MAERDRFELDLAAALRAYLDDAPTVVRPAELAHHFATAYPHGRPAIGRLGFRMAAAAWAVLLIALLTALAVGMLVVGSRPSEPLPATVPATPGASPTASPDSVDGLTHAPGRATDTVGDADGGSDIVAVTTSVTTDDKLVFEVELADNWPDPASNRLLRVRLNPDRHASCNPWLTTYILDVTGGAETSTASAPLRYEPFTAWDRWWGSPGRTTPATYDIEYAIDGPRMTLAVPLAYLAGPQTVGFQLSVPPGDEFPDRAAGDACYEIAVARGDVGQASR